MWLENKGNGLVMGVLNLTPDSFYDGSKFELASIIKKIEKYIIEGADIIDIGAFSSRPGANLISVEEENDRLMPVLRELKNFNNEVLFSVDTFRTEIAKRSLNFGVGIINDISGGDLDSEMFDFVAKNDLGYVCMHMKGLPENMQANPIYSSVVDDVFCNLKSKVEILKSKGCNKIIVDPGFGFGKSLNDNYCLLNELRRFKDLNIPILVGVSRKSMITNVLNVSPEHALNGTTIINTIAVLNGADILRVHDVKYAKEVFKLVTKL